MFRKGLTLVCLLALAFNLSCGSKKKTDDSGSPDLAASEPGSDISSQDMNFDPQGSDGGKISGLTTVNFDYDKSTLTNMARNSLKTNADWIKNNNNVIVQIEGHCDTRGSEEYNLALGERRARSVKKYLVNLGVSAKRLTIISYGEEKPVAFGETDSAHDKNRRANFVPLPK